MASNNSGTLTLTNSTLSRNSALQGGGIISNGSGVTLTVANSTISGNSAGDGGGGGMIATSTVTMTNSTLSGNSTTGTGGGIAGVGTVTVTNSTISGNSAKDGGGIGRAGGTVTLTNTIVAGNTTTSGGPDLNGAIATGGDNLIGTITGSTGIANGVNGDIVNPTPLLGTLGNNGGTTPTIPLLTGSPAIGNGNATICANTLGTAPVGGKDQRGVIRPPARCAIGAFEPFLVSAISLPSGPTGGGARVTLTGAGFVAGATVRIGGVSCTTVQVVNSTTLTCTTGAHAAGAVDVVVTVGSATVTLTNGYTYGVVNLLPGPEPPGTVGGPPLPLPGSRPAGTTGGAPNPLPAIRP